MIDFNPKMVLLDFLMLKIGNGLIMNFNPKMVLLDFDGLCYWTASSLISIPKWSY